MRDVSLRFSVSTSAPDFRRKAVTQLSSVLAGRGWELKQQSDDALVWERRYWPPLGWGLLIAVLVFGGGLLGAGDGQSSDFQWFIVLLWVGLLVGCMLIRRTAMLHLGIESHGNGAVVEFGGQADAKTAQALSELSDGFAAASRDTAPPVTAHAPAPVTHGEVQATRGEATVREPRIDALRELAELKERGALTDDEFTAEKARVLARDDGEKP